MNIIEEKKIGNQSFYRILIKTDNKTYSSNYFNFKVVSKQIQDYKYYLLYNPEFKPISQVFSYINFCCINNSINSRLKDIHALKFFYTYLYLFNKEIISLSIIDVQNLIYFLKGYSPNGYYYSINLLTVRNNKTVNSYLSVYRSYLKFLEIDNKTFNQKYLKLISIPSGQSDFKISANRYKINLPVYKSIREVPWYINLDELNRIIKTIREDFSIMDECIIRLMYQCGLRIGEVLGLTSEDLVVENIDGRYLPTIYIRNRLSDRFYQQAKTCMKVQNKKEYEKEEYQIENCGYQKIFLPHDLYNLINDYIDIQHSSLRKNKKKNYFEDCIADKVVENLSNDDFNYYIFLNSQGRRLSSQLWNFKLRKIFMSCDIPLDKGKKVHNLNHRFRHGFAMYQIQHLNCNELDLMKKLRHQNLSSVSVYFRPTISDKVRIQTEFTAQLYDNFSEI